MRKSLKERPSVRHRTLYGGDGSSDTTKSLANGFAKDKRGGTGRLSFRRPVLVFRLALLHHHPPLIPQPDPRRSSKRCRSGLPSKARWQMAPQPAARRRTPPQTPHRERRNRDPFARPSTTSRNGRSWQPRLRLDLAECCRRRPTQPRGEKVSRATRRRPAPTAHG